MSTSIVEPTLTDQDLHIIVTQVWDAYLHQDAQLPTSTAPSTAATEPMIVATVSLTGGWDGHVRIDCTPAAAADITALMLDLPAGGLDTHDVADAMGELANIVAGNIKALLPAPVSLGLPVVALGDRVKLQFPACHETNRLAVAWNDETVQLRVLRAEYKDHRGV
jgi:chemotaxis protein CheX